MCGISGFFYRDASRPIETHVLESMTQKMFHRGPDDSGFYHSQGGALGHRRLTIIDLFGGKQPMSSSDGKSVLVTNGEIYNYKELKKEYLSHIDFNSSSDTEVLLYMLKLKNNEAITLLNGMFAFAFWDIENNKVIFARDPAGQKPLFYYFGDKSFVFASELSSLTVHPETPIDIDRESLARYLIFEGYPHPSSPLRGVKKLPPGYFMELDLTKWEIHEYRYWDCIPESTTRDGVSANDYLGEFSKIFSNAVERHLRSDVDVGVFLSTGLDSPSLVKAASAIRGGGEVKTFTIKHEIASFDESAHAASVARYFGTKHHEKTLRADEFLDDVKYLLSNIDEPIADPGFLAIYQVSKFSREYVKVILSGNGSDEFFAGYTPFHALNAYKWAHRILPEPVAHILRKLASLPRSGHEYMNSMFKVQRFLRGVSSSPPELLMQWVGSFNYEELRIILNEKIEDNQLMVNSHKIPYLYKELYEENSRLKDADLINTLLHSFQQFYLPVCICNHSDKASMRVSQELRSPFLDMEMMRFANQLPPKMKYRNGQTKCMLRNYLQNDSPGDVARRQKQGFTVPIASWLTSSLKDWADDILDPVQLKKDGFFCSAEVRRMWREHQEGKANHAKPLWTILVFQNWLHEVWSSWRTN